MHTISFEDKAFPPLLKEIAKPPKKLFVRGVHFNCHAAYEKNAPVVAIVGSRRPTPYGREMAFSLARDLALHGAIVVSGLALGIDAEAHKGALEGGGVTWAVLGSGIENIQPAINRDLADAILSKNGLLFSEYAGMHEATRWTFPERNRIIAGLSHMTIVVEAAERSGALITARLALDANREVGAVPGEATSVQSHGPHMLLRDGAALIRSAEDVLETLGVLPRAHTNALDNFDIIEQGILHLLDTPKRVEELLGNLECDVQELNQKLTLLEIAGVIKNESGVFHKKMQN